MTQPISELTDRMREIFGLVVEAYLERGLPVGSKALVGQHQPVAGLDPRRDAGAGGARAAHPSAYVGRAGSRPRAGSGCSSTGSCRPPRPTRASGPRSSARSSATSRSRMRSPRRRRRCRACRTPRAWCSRRSRSCALKQLNFVPLSEARALAVLVGADGSVENRIVSLDAGTIAVGARPRSAISSTRGCRA